MDRENQQNNEKLLSEIAKLTKENNKILKSQRRGSLFAIWFKVVIVIVLIFLSYYSYIKFSGPIGDALSLISSILNSFNI